MRHSCPGGFVARAAIIDKPECNASRNIFRVQFLQVGSERRVYLAANTAEIAVTLSGTGSDGRRNAENLAQLQGFPKLFSFYVREL